MRYWMGWAALLVACQSGKDSEDTGGETGEPMAELDVAGQAFLLESAEGFDPVEGEDIRLYFPEENRYTPPEEIAFSVYAGCNSMDGSFALSADGTMSVSELATTDMWCGDALGEQEDWLRDFLMSTPNLSHEAPRLTFSTSAAELVFLEEGEEEEELDMDVVIGPKWVIDSYFEDDEVSAYNLDAPPTILFYNESIISFFDGCNSGQVEYSLEGQTLTFSNMSVTELDCSDDNLVREASEHVLAILSPGETTIALNGENILLERGVLGISGSPQQPD